MSFAAETTITVPTGAVQIAGLRAGDLVLAADLAMQWQQYVVKFAATASGATMMASVAFGNNRQIIVTFDQLFVMADRTLKRADRLEPGDSLAGGGGQAVGVQRIMAGMFGGDVCDIATSADPPSHDLAGHLLDANGVIAADYDLQVWHFDQRRQAAR